MPRSRPDPVLPPELSTEYLEQYGLVPVDLSADHVRAAAAGVPDLQVIDDLTRLLERPVEIVDVSPEELTLLIRRAADNAMSLDGVADDVVSGVATSDELGTVADVRDLAHQAPVVRYVSLLLREATEARASDVHLDALNDAVSVRMRVDGVLTEMDPPPRALLAGVVSRIKLLANLDIAERRVPQDGRLKLRLADHEIDVRVSTVPSFHGESVVLRLLDRAGGMLTLDDLGMPPTMVSEFRKLAARPNGMVIVTGPTGSGKTTSLYAALAMRDRAAEKIVTVEDPIEYSLPGVTQIPVNEKAGVSFASVLRSVLRQDPDVVLVGEMRDRETADIAIRAAMTGHMVFSTLHTNNALGAIPRLMDLGIESYLVSATIEGILAQRLVRRVCQDCVMPYQPDAQLVAALAEGPVGRPKLFRGAGCDVCRGSGFRGRIGVFEFLVFEDEIKQLIAQGEQLSKLRATAKSQGMVTLREDAWTKVQAGLTTVEEVLRVVAA